MANFPDLPQGLSMEKLKELSASPMGQALLSQLQNQQSKELEDAVKQAQTGDFEQVKRSVSDFLRTPAGQELMKQLRGQNNG